MIKTMPFNELVPSKTNAPVAAFRRSGGVQGSRPPAPVKETAGSIELAAHAASLSVPLSAKRAVRLTTTAESTMRQAEVPVEP